MSSKTYRYFSNDKQVAIAKKLGLRPSAFREKIVRVEDFTSDDSGEQLILVHYDIEKLEKMQAEKNPSVARAEETINLSHCRGRIFDISTMTEVLRSFPQTANIETLEVPTDRLLSFKLRENIMIPTSGYYKECYGGALLKVWHFNGKVRFSTNKKIDATKSHFGDSDTFVSILFRSQDVFPTPESFFPPGSDFSTIHLFIINDRKLLVDTRENQNEDRVIYLKSYTSGYPTENRDMTFLIETMNETSTKPIIICKPLTPDQVNRRLRGDGSVSFSSDEMEMNKMILMSAISHLSGGEKVIYENNLGIFTLVPPSCKFRQHIMDGKNNIYKLFVDCMADRNNKKNLVNIAFTLDDLYLIARKLENNEADQINLDEHTIVTENRGLIILTNLLFIVPINRIGELFESYRKFDTDLKAAIEYLIERYDDLMEGISTDALESFEGITSKGFRKFLCDKIPYLLEEDIAPGHSWSEVAKRLYKDYYTELCRYPDDQEKQMLCTLKMATVSIVGNADGDLLYTIIGFEEKARKTRVAFMKRTITQEPERSEVYYEGEVKKMVG